MGFRFSEPRAVATGHWLTIGEEYLLQGRRGRNEFARRTSAVVTNRGSELFLKACRLEDDANPFGLEPDWNLAEPGLGWRSQSLRDIR
jgi:hypothetical protein